MAPLLQILLLLAIVIFLAKAAGWLASRLGQPAVLGELLVGLLLGPTVLNVLGWPAFSDATTAEMVTLLAEVGVIVLMLIAGLEVDLRELRRAGRSALLSGVLGVVFALAGGWGISLLFGYDSPTAFALGVLLAATSVSISAQVLLELGALRSQEGMALLGAAVVDDILVIVILSAEMAFRGGQGGVEGVFLVLGRMVLFLGVGGFLCLWGLPRLMRYVDRWPVSAAVPATALVVTFFFAWASDFLGGIGTITGAFLVGLGLRRSAVHRNIVEAMHTMGYALFVPLFFVGVGLQANLRTLNAGLLAFVGVLILATVVSKAWGNGLGAWLGGLPPAAALRVGLGMIPRGEVTLIAATVEMRAGWVDKEFFAVAVLMVLVTALASPLLLRRAFRPAEARLSRQGR